MPDCRRSAVVAAQLRVDRQETRSTSPLQSSGHALVMSSTMRVAIILLIFASVRSGSVNDCHGVRYAYGSGLLLEDVPRQPRQGSHLQICPRGLTCCTSSMERRLRLLASDAFVEAVGKKAQVVQRLFAHRAHRFDEFFRDLLSESKQSFHRLFQRTYGIIYERNSDVFIDFFKDLENFYNDHDNDEKRDKDRGLEDTLEKFFGHLYQRMFVVFNSQHSFDYPYLRCVSDTMRTLEPFGDVPEKLGEQLRRSFVATRVLAHSLQEGKRVVNAIVKLTPHPRCASALTRMSKCPPCQGLRDVLPCRNYCLNVMKGCLYFHQQLHTSWNEFIDDMSSLTDMLLGPLDLESVVEPIGVKISDAIMNFQNTGFEVTSKVFKDCGQPKRSRRDVVERGHAYGRPVMRSSSSRSSSSSSFSSSSSPSSSSDSQLKSLLREIKSAVATAKDFWVSLADRLCDDQSDDNSDCWNGSDLGSYTLPVSNLNSEVAVDPSRPDVAINELILRLRRASHRMQQAAKGQNVDWPRSDDHPEASNDEDHDTGGSGDEESNMCDSVNDDEDCYDTYSGEKSSDEVKTNGLTTGSGDEKNNWKSKMSDDDFVYDDNDDDDDAGLVNWPPWMTSTTTLSSRELEVDVIEELDHNSLDLKAASSEHNSPSFCLNVILTTLLTSHVIFR